MRWWVSARLPGLLLILAAAVPAVASSASQQDFLKPDDAFRFSANTAANGEVVAHWDIAEGYYLYRKRFKFAVTDPGVTLGDARFPAGDMKNDEFFGKMEVYHHGVDARIPVHNGGATAALTLSVTYQGCAQAGMCYPPVTKRVALKVPPAAAAGSTGDVSSGPGDAPAANNAAAPTVPVSEEDSIARSLAGDNRLVALLAFFGFGLLLSFTPCVFPMMPILSSIIVGQGEAMTTRKAFVLSLVYVLSVSVTYTLTGVAAGLLGENIQAAFQNPWAIGAFAAIFVALSLSMFGFYDLQLPGALQSRLAEISNSQQGGRLIGVAVMGFLSALIVGPCVAAPLAGALIYIGQTGDAVLGGLALFSLSLGMGVPLLVIGTSAGKLLPKAGTWMEAIKAVFGVMLLGLAIWMLDRIVPSWVTLALTAALITVSAVFLGALDSLAPDAGGWRRLWKGVGVVMLINGALLFISLGLGGMGSLQAFQGGPRAANGVGAQAQSHMAFDEVKGIDDLERRLTEAGQAGRPVMLDFYADWCVSCKELEKFTFSDPQVQAALKDAVLLQADVTRWNDNDKRLAKKFQVIGPPAVLFFDARTGEEKRAYRVVGFMKADRFLDHVNTALALQ